jgi:hypothetical protein
LNPESLSGPTLFGSQDALVLYVTKLKLCPHRDFIADGGGGEMIAFKHLLLRFEDVELREENRWFTTVRTRRSWKK